MVIVPLLFRFGYDDLYNTANFDDMNGDEDGIHFDADGHQTVANKWWKTISQLIP